MKWVNKAMIKDFILIGQAGAGKDTAYEIMNSIEPKYQRLAFGDAIRDVASSLRSSYIGATDIYSTMTMLFYPRLPPKDLQRKLYELSQIPYEPPKDRRLLQELGTWAREYDDEIWMRVVSDAMESDSKWGYVITDCRRRSELTKFRNLISVYIECPEDIRLERLKKRDVTFDEASLRHKAEQEIPSLREDCDFIVYNDGDMDYLREQLGELLKYVNF